MEEFYLLFSFPLTYTHIVQKGRTFNIFHPLKCIYFDNSSSFLAYCDRCNYHCIFFTEHRFYLHIIYPDYSVLSFYSSKFLPTSLSSRSNPFLSLIRKQNRLLRDNKEIIRQNKNSLEQDKKRRKQPKKRHKKQRCRSPLVLTLRNTIRKKIKKIYIVKVLTWHYEARNLQRCH